MGVGGVGKSAITNRFVIGRWVEKYDPTIEESYQTTVDIDGKALQIEILDTAGQDDYTPLRETFMHTGDGFLLVYSITDDQTLEELREIKDQITRVHRDRKVPIVVLGNKVDLEKKDRAVSKEEGKALANNFGAAFLEVSAKNNFKVKEGFETLIRKILAKKPKGGQDEGSGSVFGAGKVDNSGEEFENKGRGSKTIKREASKAEAAPAPPSSPATKAGAGDDNKKKSSKCLIL